MEVLTIDWVKQNGLLIFEVISGSKSYGLDTTKSDTDIRGVFVLPKDMYYSLEYTAQVNNETNDIAYYELRKFMELLSKNNPNILEMLNTPDQFVLQKNAIMGKLNTNIFLSRLCEKTFANYAFTQIKKAYGLEKKIVNPVEEERKSVLDFCYVYENKKSVPLIQFLETKQWQQNQIGLSVIAHLRDCYNIYYSDVIKYSGVIKKGNANDVALSSIPKGEISSGLLYFNKDGYSVYCKKYKEYWEWVSTRNEARYNTTMSHGKNYDSKNMMHVFRLLMMAKEIATEGTVNVYRKDREFLLAIKEGRYEYDELLSKAKELRDELPAMYETSGLQQRPDVESINRLLIEMRKEYYNES